MDQHIYSNVEEPSYNCYKRKTFSENIYENANESHAQGPHRTGPALSVSGADDVKKSSCRAAAVFLGLLCLLLLAGLITLVFLYTRGRSEWEKEMVQLQTDYSNLTRERDELNNSFNNLTEKLEQLQTSYNILTKEQDQLQKRFEEMNERKDFQRMIEDKRHCGPWRSFGSKYYYISSEQKTWEESREDCRQKGTDLVIINSEEEQQFLIALNKRVWIGLTDQEEEGVWKWVDGTALSTRYWLPSQPDNYGEEDCAEIQVEKWNDIPCSQNNHWVCETVDV